MTSLQTVTAESEKTISAFWSVKPWIIGKGNPFPRRELAYGKHTVSMRVHTTGCKRIYNMLYLEKANDN